MTREAHIHRSWTMFVGSAVLGAAAMFLLDPDKGRRRRAIARDKARSLVCDTRDAVGVARRDASHRMHGWRARARRLFDAADHPDDLRLIERVRARIGRIVSHPHAIQVGANDGRVTLSGPILPHEVQRLLAVVRTVWGVVAVEDRLVVHEHAESISSLQGGSDPRGRPHEHWPPALRMGAVVAGAALVVGGLRRGSIAGYAIAGAGIALAARGATNLPARRLANIANGQRTFDLARSIEVSTTPEAAFDLCRRWESFPSFMTHVESVRDLGEGLTRWTLAGAAGTRLEWDAHVTHAIRPQLLAWRTPDGSLVRHVGSMRFEPFADGTRISLTMSYDAAGGVAHALALMLGTDPRRRMNEDLARMKAFIESHPPAPANVQPQPDARPQ